VRKQTPLRRLAGPDDVARVVLFYASPLADFVTGANIAPDGGLAVF
jgi:NAD(P)-dependent dehydrogenase (short-subunit alcohol dehydrogenase family)